MDIAPWRSKIAPPLSTTKASDNRDESDARLAAAFAARESWALNETYRRYAALLFSIALGVLREDAAAEDCVHDTIVRLWERPDSYRPERGALRPFLVVAVRNEALTARRTALRRLAKLPKLYDARTPADPAEIVASPRLTEYVNRLPEPQRDAIVLAYVRGWTHREIADELSLPLGTVKSRLHLALRQLARALGTGPA